MGNRRIFKEIYGGCDDCALRKLCRDYVHRKLGKRATYYPLYGKCAPPLVKNYYKLPQIMGRILFKAKLGD